MAALNAELSDLHEEAGLPSSESQERLRSSARE